MYSKALPEAGPLLPNFDSQLKARSACRALNPQVARQGATRGSCRWQRENCSCLVHGSAPPSAFYGESKPGTLGERRLYSHSRDHAREWRSALQRIGIKKGMQVLDLGCGDGTTALPAARLGADVLGVDIARNLVEAGNKLAAEQGLTNLKFREGDATNLRGDCRTRNLIW